MNASSIFDIPLTPEGTHDTVDGISIVRRHDITKILLPSNCIDIRAAVQTLVREALAGIERTK